MNAKNQMFDVVVIGAGQAGLASGWHLQQQGLNFLIFDEQPQPGGNWRNYYDSLELFSPAAYSSLPGLPFPGAAGHYPTRDEVVRYLERYADFFRLPILQGIRVANVCQEGEGFRITATIGQCFRREQLSWLQEPSVVPTYPICLGSITSAALSFTVLIIGMQKHLVGNASS